MLKEPEIREGRPADLFTAPAAAARLLDRIRTRQATVAVVGMGYVGLGLAVAFAEAGFPVVGIDVDRKKVEALNAGRSYVPDVSPEKLTSLVANGASDDTAPGRLRATSDYDALFGVDAVIICVPTPLSATKDPDISYIVSAADEIAQRLRRGMLIVLESTTYPGTTDEILLPRLQRAQVEGESLQAGRDFYLAFSPERIDPGRRDYTVHSTPKVIGGATPACLAMAKALYECAIQTIVPVSTTQTAEMVKLVENTFRAVNIGLMNEIAMMCDRLHVDVWEVIDAAKTKPFGFMPFYPGPGLGGHCIPIDPHYLSWKLKTLDYNARFIHLAEEINFGMPRFVLDRIANALNQDCKPLNGARVLILGVAYKANINDLRESPALDLMRLLHEKGAQVAYNDPYVPLLTLNGLSLASVPLEQASLQTSDCVVIATDHKVYDWAWVVANSRLVVDTRNATASVPAGAGRIVKI